MILIKSPAARTWQLLLISLLALAGSNASYATTGCRFIAHGKNDLWTFTANVAVNPNDGTLDGGSVTLQYIDRENLSGMGLGAGSQVAVLASDVGRSMTCTSLGGGTKEVVVRSTEGGGYLKFNGIVIGDKRTPSGTDRGEIVFRIVVYQDDSVTVDVMPTGLEVGRVPLLPFTVEFADLGSGFVDLGTASGRSTCVNPLTAPSDQTARSSWDELLALKPSKNLNTVITSIQDIDSNGVGDVNLDYYSVTIDGNGQSPGQLLAELRSNIQSYIYGGTSYTVAPYDNSNKAKWDSAAPKGAVMVFTLAGYSGVPFERGAVVVSCFDVQSFVFSTVSISGALEAGDHPVSGNRAFGVKGNADGSLTIYVKAADRRKADNSIFALMGSKKIFDLGAEVWQGLIRNLQQKYSDRNPREVVIYQRAEVYAPPAA
jgi:hypothetical protein